jgi:hypothetical protein
MYFFTKSEEKKVDVQQVEEKKKEEPFEMIEGTWKSLVDEKIRIHEDKMKEIEDKLIEINERYSKKDKLMTPHKDSWNMIPRKD